jgi:hypothetical protein
MSNLDLTTNQAHPIHNALNELHALTKTWLAGVLSPAVAKMQRGTARALGAVQVASTGRRCGYFLGVASESLLLTRGGYYALFLEREISSEIFDEARRRINRILVGLEQLKTVPLAEWSTVELPVLEAPPQTLDEDPTIKPLRRILVKAAKAARLVRPKAPPGQRDPATEGAS